MLFRNLSFYVLIAFFICSLQGNAQNEYDFQFGAFMDYRSYTTNSSCVGALSAGDPMPYFSVGTSATETPIPTITNHQSGQFQTPASIPNSGLTPVWFDYSRIFDGNSCETIRSRNSRVDFGQNNANVTIRIKSSAPSYIDFCIGSFYNSTNENNLNSNFSTYGLLNGSADTSIVRMYTNGTDFQDFDIDLSQLSGWEGWIGRFSIDLFGFVTYQPNISYEIQYIYTGKTVCKVKPIAFIEKFSDTTYVCADGIPNLEVALNRQSLSGYTNFNWLRANEPYDFFQYTANGQFPLSNHINNINHLQKVTVDVSDPDCPSFVIRDTTVIYKSNEYRVYQYPQGIDSVTICPSVPLAFKPEYGSPFEKIVKETWVVNGDTINHPIGQPYMVDPSALPTHISVTAYNDCKIPDTRSYDFKVQSPEFEFSSITEDIQICTMDDIRNPKILVIELSDYLFNITASFKDRVWLRNGDSIIKSRANSYGSIDDFNVFFENSYDKIIISAEDMEPGQVGNVNSPALVLFKTKGMGGEYQMQIKDKCNNIHLSPVIKVTTPYDQGFPEYNLTITGDSCGQDSVIVELTDLGRDSISYSWSINETKLYSYKDSTIIRFIPPSNTNYFVSVDIKDHCAREYSQILKQPLVSCEDSIYNNSSGAPILVSPNPASGMTTIQLNEPFEYDSPTLPIVYFDGSQIDVLISKIDNYTYLLNIAPLLDGLYFVVIDDQKIKLLVQN